MNGHSDIEIDRMNNDGIERTYTIRDEVADEENRQRFRKKAKSVRDAEEHKAFIRRQSRKVK